jgi:PhoPQ-activated pathogenicity-related protein
VRSLKIAALLCLCCGHLAVAQEAPQTVPVTLKGYVKATDPLFKWEKRDGGAVAGVKWARLHMVSQQWKGTTWKHVVWMIVPDSKEKTSEHALLYISGGGWKPEWSEDGPAQLPPSDDVQRMASLAKATNSPVCIVQHVPFQPMFGGLVEDEIISLTFVEYLNSGDGTWPLLLPMVKSAVRAMDAADQFMQQEHSSKLTKFTVFGGSKRGWTTWLSSAIDARVEALAPIVIDVLNMNEQMKFQKQTWGKYSEQIEDYSSKGILEQMDTPKGRQLLTLVDPYQYRDLITQPKLLIFGTNDPYWPVDACHLYWNALQGEKHLLYVPNQGHGIKDMERVLGSIAALQRSRHGGQPLPKMQWSFQPEKEYVRLNLTLDQPAEQVRGWIATSQTRDFREATWSESPMKAANKGFEFEAPRNGAYLAMFGEVVIDNKPVDAFFSTNLQVFEPVGGE